MEELYTIVGKMYVDIYNMQKILESLQKQLLDKDTELRNLKTSKETDDRGSN